jgi:hypothetical protein
MKTFYGVCKIEKKEEKHCIIRATVRVNHRRPRCMDRFGSAVSLSPPRPPPH